MSKEFFDLERTPPFLAFRKLREIAHQAVGEANVLDLSQGEPGYGFSPSKKGRRTLPRTSRPTTLAGCYGRGTQSNPGASVGMALCHLLLGRDEREVKTEQVMIERTLFAFCSPILSLENTRKFAQVIQEVMER